MIKEIIVVHLIPNFILISSMIYVWHKLLKININFKDYRLYISLFSIMIISILNYLVVEKFIRIILVTISLMPFFKFLFRETLQKSIITPILYQLFGLIAESIYAIVFALILGPKFEEFLTTSYGFLITNISIAIITIFISTRKLSMKFYGWLLDITDKIKKIQLVPLSMILIIILNVADMAAYYKIKFEYLLLFNVMIIVICSALVVYSLLTQNKYNRVSDKYNIAIKSLNDYEDMMTKYRVANHENKNLLLTVRAMILNKDKDIPKYIDSIIEDKYVDSEKLLLNVSSIPSGGLRATIYSEILKIKDNRINYKLNIDRDIKAVDLIELDTSTIVDICKIIGVVIDNSIEAVKDLKTKEINISLYVENKKMCIKVSNNYKGKIDIEKMSDEGYTTKGIGHGYGLSLVKRIVSANDSLEIKTEISKNIFSQIICIKYKKTH